MAGKVSEREKAKYLEKIAEWRSLGFDVEGLEELLDEDFELFKKRRLEILRGQISDTEKPSVAVTKVPEVRDQAPDGSEEAREMKDDEGPGPRAPDTEEEDVILVGEEQPAEDVETIDIDDEEVTLVGKPLPVEPPAPDDEDTILIGGDDYEEAEEDEEKPVTKVKKVPKEKAAAGVREVESDVGGDDRRKKEARPEPRTTVPEDDDEAEVPMGMMGLEVPAERKAKGKEKKTEKGRTGRRSPAAARVQTVRVTAVVIAGIIIMAFLWYMIYSETSPDNGDNGNGTTEVEAVLTVDKTTGSAGEMFYFNAESSTGDIKAYQWVFDTDFRKTTGFYDSAVIAGYFAPTEAAQKDYSVSLTVESQDGQMDTETTTITVLPLEVNIPEEQLGDVAKYRVAGDMTISNPSGEIASISYATGNPVYGSITLSVDQIVLYYKNTTGEPMTSEITDAVPTEDGFMNKHQVYSRHIRQDLIISGNMETSIDSIAGHYQESLPIMGTMKSDEESFTDYTTDKTVQIHTTNELDLSSTVTEPITIPLTINSDDELTSYPDLRQIPTRLRLSDLSDGTIGLGDKDTTIFGSVAYTWQVISADQVLGSPALKLDVFVDSKTLEANNIDDFRFHIWLGDGKPVALKTEAHVEFSSEGNDVIINYENRLTEYISGDTAISSKSCNNEFNSSYHYPVRYSDMKSDLRYEFHDNWSYIPHTKIADLDNSFEDFSTEYVMQNYVLSSTGVTNFLASNPDAYVITGYLNATMGDPTWNMTLGTKDSTDGYYMRVGKTMGVIAEGELEVNRPNNSTSDMWPVSTFAGSEYIFKDISDPEITSNIFFNDKVNFVEVSYGVSASLSYPTVDFTSISNFQTQRLAYFALRERADGWFTTALDAETGQLLFKWDHTYEGLEIPVG